MERKAQTTLIIVLLSIILIILFILLAVILIDSSSLIKKDSRKTNYDSNKVIIINQKPAPKPTSYTKLSYDNKYRYYRDDFSDWKQYDRDDDKYIVYVRNTGNYDRYFTVKFYFKDRYGNTITKTQRDYVDEDERGEFIVYNRYSSDWDYEVIPGLRNYKDYRYVKHYHDGNWHEHKYYDDDDLDDWDNGYWRDNMDYRYLNDKDCDVVNWDEDCYMDRWGDVWRGWDY